MSTGPLKNLVIVGAGGHAKVVVDCVSLSGEYEIVALIDETEEDGERLGYKLLKHPPQTENENFIVAIGDNKLRQHKFTQMVARGFKPITIVHPSAIVAKDATIGDGTLVCAGAIVNPGVTIGLNCIINTAASVDHDCIIRDHVHVAPGCRLAGGVTIGEGALLGIGSSFIPKITVGEWSVTGAGAVVVRDVDVDTTVVGVPAKKIGTTGA